MISGVGIVKEKIRTAAGEKLCLRQKDVQLTGHAVECRIDAEDPEHNFMPSPGKIANLGLPGGPGVRINPHIYCRYTIPSQYDSPVGKLMVHAEGRVSAVARRERAPQELRINGIETTIPFHKKVRVRPEFRKGHYTTPFIDQIL